MCVCVCVCVCACVCVRMCVCDSTTRNFARCVRVSQPHFVDEHHFLIERDRSVCVCVCVCVCVPRDAVP